MVGSILFLIDRERKVGKKKENQNPEFIVILFLILFLCSGERGTLHLISRMPLNKGSLCYYFEISAKMVLNIGGRVLPLS